MSDSPYTVEDPLTVFTNPSGIGREDTCQMKWAVPKLLGVEARPKPRGMKDELDAKVRGIAVHKLIDFAMRRFAESGQVYAYEGREGKAYAREAFDAVEEKRACELREDECADILAAARSQIPLLGLERFEVVRVGGAPAIELDVKVVLDGPEYAGGGLPFQAVVDAVLRHRTTAEVWVVDWKTSEDAINSADTANATELDRQLELQRLVLENYGAEPVRPDRAALVQIRSLAPGPVPLTAKTNKVTRSLKQLSCTAAEYRQALVDNGEDPDDPKLAPKYEALRHLHYVRWLPDISTPSQRAQMRRELFARAREHQALARGEKLPRMLLSNMSGHMKYVRNGCDRCDLRKWCQATLANDGQPDFTLVGLDYVLNDKASTATVELVKQLRAESRTRTYPNLRDRYADFCRAYGQEPHAFEPFKP